MDAGLEKDINLLRGFQRHRLLREFTEAGQVPADNLAVSEAIDRIIARLTPISDASFARLAESLGAKRSA